MRKRAVASARLKGWLSWLAAGTASLVLAANVVYAQNIAAKVPTAQPATAEPAKRSMRAFPEDAATPMKVGIALYFQDVSKISEATGTFDATFDLQTRWIDSRLAFDSKAIGTSRQEYLNEAAVAKLATVWTPAVVVSNLSERAPRIEHCLFVAANGSVTYIQRYKGTFDAKYKTLPFPFDSQALSIGLVSIHHNIHEIEFTQARTDREASGTRDAFTVYGWMPAGVRFAISKTRGVSGDYYPKIEAAVTVKRDAEPHIFTIFGPLLLILLIPTLVTFYIKADVAPRLTLWSASILALIAFSFTLGVRYPALDAGNLVTQSISIGFAYQLFMVGLTSTLFNPASAEKFASKHLLPELIFFCRWFIPLAILGLFVTRTLLTALS